MFSRVANASKVALAALVDQLAAWQFDMLDCQVTTEHMLGLGAREIRRAPFLARLRTSLEAETRVGPWSFDAASRR